jgi:putative membrane protein
LQGFLVRFLVTAIALAVAAAIVPGMHFEGSAGVFLAAFLLGFVNGVIRPALVVLTLPITIVTLGLFLLILNAALLGLVAALVDSFHLDGFFAALLGSILVSIVSGIASWTIGPTGRVEIWIERQSK